MSCSQEPLIIREMNEPVMVIQATLFTSNCNYRVVHSLTPFLQKSIVHILLKLIYICGHFLTVNNHRYSCCYVKKFIPLCTLTEFHTGLKANSARSFQNAFYKCSRALNMIYIFLTMAFFLNDVIFSLSSHLNIPYSLVNFKIIL